MTTLLLVLVVWVAVSVAVALVMGPVLRATSGHPRRTQRAAPIR